MTVTSSEQLPRFVRSAVEETENVVAYFLSLSLDHQGHNHVVLTTKRLLIGEVSLLGPSRHMAVHTVSVNDIATLNFHRGPFAWGLRRDYSATVETFSGSRIELTHLKKVDVLALRTAFRGLSKATDHQ